MNKISSITRREIISVLVHGIDEASILSPFHYDYDLFGLMNPVDFLNRLYPLAEFPSKDAQYRNAEDEIRAHTRQRPTDYPEGWIFEDERFSLGSGPDEKLLDFLCEVFHPEVRDESGHWEIFWHYLNQLLNADGYTMYRRGQISKRFVYGWRDTSIPRFQFIKENEIKYFTKLLSSHGNVVDFYRREEFDDFTNEAIGIRLCEYYPNSSKGGALHQYLDDCMDETMLQKILSALLARYEQNCLSAADDQTSNLYRKCRSILDRAHGINKITHDAVRNLQQAFSSEYLASEMTLMLKMQEENPTEAIGKAKELIESCCKTILEAKAIPLGKRKDLTDLVSETVKLLKIRPQDIPDDHPMATTIKSILGSLRAIATGLAELRNMYGSGHGRSYTYKGLQPRHAKLAVGCSTTLVQFLWDSFQRQTNTPS